ncbi:thioredoxin-like protein [Aureobasidium sp. EXF-3400]|nr:thioredoxin-like protein [Aureobasidium sp. EXF-12344]KAI4777130.1 thioredoxin-like protein [Aureobasidium sp. EXF-3400]
MRSLLISPLIALSFAASVFAAPPIQNDAPALPPPNFAGDAALNVPRDAPDAPASPAKDPEVKGETKKDPVTDGADSGPKGTVFNGVNVPPITELSGTTLDQDISKGTWLVEFFSPYCHHCKSFAPTWQTLHEFYYTSDPLPASKDSPDSLNSFTRFYDFKFAKLDCVAFGSACSDKNINSFPTVVQFKDGKEVDRKVGALPMKDEVKWIEPMLEAIKPGSRQKDGPKLPKVGATSSPDFKGAAVVGPAKEADAIAEATKSTTSSTSTKSLLKATKIAKETANPAGTSVPLTAETFQQKVTTTHDPWFIKFYAPWCHHCQAMAPSWHAMARDMKNKLNIGEVNCEVERRLCKDVNVKGYPTLIYFQGGERIEYEGLRGLGDLISYANKAVSAGDGVVDVDAAAFEALEKEEEVIFLYFYDHATTSEDFQALERLLLSLIGHAKLVKTNDPALSARYKISTWPRLIVSRDGKPTYYTPLSPRDMRDFRKVLGWMQANWLPIVPELTSSNARDIMDHRLVVLAILSRERKEDFVIAKRELKSAALEWIDKEIQAFQLERQELRDAKQLRIEEAEDRNDQRGLRSAKQIRIDMNEINRKEVGFAWVDGVFWERWLKTTFGIDVKDGEKVVINDEDNQRYWDLTSTGNPIVPSRVSILETLPKVVASPPKISPKHKNSFFGHLIWTFQQIRHASSELKQEVARNEKIGDARSGLSRVKNLLLGTTITAILAFGYLYVTDTRATFHQWLVPRVLRTLFPDAEDAHKISNKTLKALYSVGLHPRERGNPDVNGDLKVEVFGHVLDNPIGTSAGLDKNADIPDVVLGFGAGIVEVGGITPRPQEGNPKPRVWRIPSQNALINRYGLNSEGADSVATRLRQRLREFAYAIGLGLDPVAEQSVLDGYAGVPPGSQMPGRLLAVQIAKMKETPDNDIDAIAQDYVYCVNQLAKYADILVVNVSSPNTPGLRNLQQAAPLTKILTAVVDAAQAADRKTKPAVMVKVSPDEDSEEQVSGICGAVWASGVDGIIVGNTTKKRPDALPAGYLLPQNEQSIMLETGGYSGPQLFERTVALVKKYRATLDKGPNEAKPEPKKIEEAPKQPEKSEFQLETEAMKEKIRQQLQQKSDTTQSAAPNSLDAETKASIESSVERDLKNLKPKTEAADKNSRDQSIIQIPERHIPSSVSSSSDTTAAETKAAFSAVEPALGAVPDAAEKMLSSGPASSAVSANSTKKTSLSAPASLNTNKEKVIFATGGITNGKQALEVLNAGASVAMVYTAMVYGGAGTITRIKQEMREEIHGLPRQLPSSAPREER